MTAFDRRCRLKQAIVSSGKFGVNDTRTDRQSDRHESDAVRLASPRVVVQITPFGHLNCSLERRRTKKKKKEELEERRNVITVAYKNIKRYGLNRISNFSTNTVTDQVKPFHMNGGGAVPHEALHRRVQFDRRFSVPASSSVRRGRVRCGDLRYVKLHAAAALALDVTPDNGDVNRPAAPASGSSSPAGYRPMAIAIRRR
ncbi:hypothetical protein EVAR_96750_1 [Eumeta japonica]|uniref:Uncharacterized protein n=1 Tax=Eumeta variegata TaxID=151549 RepID=A0A4C1Y019_EUMVA|nr:hypothetical protein EVAR_96750_1 [Eumeta japonica]